ncbi:hypothetical protein BLL42_22900 [Pseudomonas frederiksbergensis]|uniref:Uncharacterized protein n=1 Tax=Pseudomonas frederiksbergensis TaxID=104087 RepID=A0A1J0ER58_9PSED|nr:hypothetical protein BLL42_22900 [Pseudomonas frederiksbergensis]
MSEASSKHYDRYAECEKNRVLRQKIEQRCAKIAALAFPNEVLRAANRVLNVKQNDVKGKRSGPKNKGLLLNFGVKNGSHG